VRLRGLNALLLPVTAALLAGIVVGAYLVAPLLDPGAASANRQPGAAVAGASSAAGSNGAGTAAGASARPAGSAGARAPVRPGSSAASGTSPAALAPAAEGVVPILYYHRVDPLPAGFSGWSKKRQDTFLVDDTLPFSLVAQLDWLVDHGYTTILPRDLAAHWDSGKALPKRPIILTFDDGFSSWRSFVLPQLQKRGMVAEFYVVIANVGRSISWADIRALAKAGNGIGAHDVQHVQLAGGGVTTASAATMRYQVTEAKRLIELNVGVKVDSMAYVGGGFNATLMRIVQEAGYTTARSIERGVLQKPGIRFHLHVSRIGWKDDVVNVYTGKLVPGLPTFAKRVSGANPG
jgi:peptidoglycan/xylan/chitin deacetylase (PgdA/CDA1 family)